MDTFYGSLSVRVNGVWTPLGHPINMDTFYGSLSVRVNGVWTPPGHPINMDTFYGSLSVRVNGVWTPPDTPLIWTLSMAPSVSVLTGFEGNFFIQKK